VDLSFLPSVNATLNAVAAGLLVFGRGLARRGRIHSHRRVMTAAFAVSSLFLVLYVAHKASRGFENTTFHTEGPAKLAYLLRRRDLPAPVSPESLPGLNPSPGGREKPSKGVANRASDP
jgi:hypothetical protein